MYIDPPFSSESDLQLQKGQKAYTDRIKGSEFIEFLRRRLILAKEILSLDGLIFVHLDQKMNHYIKIVMDEVFGKENFRGEIISKRNEKNDDSEFVWRIPVSTNFILVYSKSVNSKMGNFLISGGSKGYWKNDFTGKGANVNDYELYGSFCKDIKKNRHWMWNKEDAYKAVDNFKKFIIDSQNQQIQEFYNLIIERLPKPISKKELKEYQPIIKEMDKLFEEYAKQHQDKKFLWVNPSTGKPCYWKHESEVTVVGNNWASFNIEAYGDQSLYPTAKHEELLSFIIRTQTQPNDLVLDFFAGSGTTAAVAEKLGRRWIVCDIGKLAFYTMQKRILTIQDSKDLENPKKKYGKKARSFITVNTGLYDLKKVFELKKDDYIKFVMNLFEVEPIEKKIAGIKIDGQKKDGYYVLIYPYWQFKDAAVDEEYLEDLHSHIGKRVGGRLYIIAPANYVDFISDYHEIENTRYYFLKVPYQIIKELHKVQFKKFRQPQSKRNVNDLDDAIGFHFIRQPDVESKVIKKNGKLEIHITKFLSNYLEEETGNELKNFESLAMVLIDKDYNDKEFVMDEFYFAEDLIPDKKENETEDEIKEDLSHQEKIVIPIKEDECGDKVMVIYIDIYGNEFKEVFQLRE
ncbi:DNA methyltransferase [Thermodesulfovibrio sp. Kuro-1]|uniref:DNA methyltransferase n=1 Tax=Thermodesulfovibrio sp. Kuro-1 TaxID=2580394 RepID=UPI0021076E7C|nr:site-specific DNA-methyltransferase [Thermodesulfovibrio sp. Kuro-1]